MDKWERDETRYLIYLYKQQPCLYDPKHKDYLKKNCRLHALNFIKRELSEIKPEITVSAVRRKIKTLLSQLSREKLIMRKCSERERSAENVYKPRLWCFHELKFLLHINGASTEKFNETHDSFSVDQNECNDTPKHDPTPKGKHETTISGSDLLSDIKKTIQIAKSLQINNHQKSKEETFGELLAVELKELKFEESYESAVKSILQRIYDVKYKERQSHYETAFRSYFEKNNLNETVNAPPSSSLLPVQILTLKENVDPAANDTDDNTEIIYDEDMAIKIEIDD